MSSVLSCFPCQHLAVNGCILYKTRDLRTQKQPFNIWTKQVIRVGIGSEITVISDRRAYFFGRTEGQSNLFIMEVATRYPPLHQKKALPNKPPSDECEQQSLIKYVQINIDENTNKYNKQSRVIYYNLIYGQNWKRIHNPGP